MYVNPYWFGVLTTVVVEIVALFVWAFVIDSRGKKR